MTGGRVAHGHVRLAILDLDRRSDQPLVYGGTVISYTGELWNYRALRAEMETDGYRFETTGDTEVVAAMVDAHGADAFEMMDGQFALAWTDRAGSTWLARDRMGEVPLYVLDDGLQGVSWATERKAWDAPMAARAVAVPAGSTWCVGSTPVSYYDLPVLDPEAEGTPEGVLAILRRAVERRLQSDVPVTCLCSGGLDSSLILALVCEQTEDVIAYHATFRGGEDLEMAQRVTDHVGVPLLVVDVPEPDDAALRASIATIEVTSKTQVEIGTLACPLARRLRDDGFKVVLSGEGADELFGGYGTLARKATDDVRWSHERGEFLRKMARSDLLRVNKTLFSAGVEPRTPFLDRELVDYVLPLSRKRCPAGKGLLKKAAKGLLPDEVIRRPKLTFQGGAGVADALAQRLNGAQRKRYNAIAREVFGGVPVG